MTSKIGVRSVVSRSLSQVSTTLHGEVVALSVSKGRYFKMTGVGAAIWDLLREPVTVGDICASLVAAYAVESEECLAGAVSFLEDLRRADLLALHDGTHSVEFGERERP